MPDDLGPFIAGTVAVIFCLCFSFLIFSFGLTVLIHGTC